MPLFQKKPFIVLGRHGHHALLRYYGFLLYDELFDYSFDYDPILEHRCDAIAGNIIRISKMTQYEMSSMYQTLLPKLEYNYNLARKIALDKNNIPEIINESFQDPSNNLCSRDVVDFIMKS